MLLYLFHPSSSPPPASLVQNVVQVYYTVIDEIHELPQKECLP